LGWVKKAIVNGPTSRNMINTELIMYAPDRAVVILGGEGLLFQTAVAPSTMLCKALIIVLITASLAASSSSPLLLAGDVVEVLCRVRHEGQVPSITKIL